MLAAYTSPGTPSCEPVVPSLVCFFSDSPSVPPRYQLESGVSEDFAITFYPGAVHPVGTYFEVEIMISPSA
mgnify:CR=1 FL=1